jgi:hypothetical protein
MNGWIYTCDSDSPMPPAADASEWQHHDVIQIGEVGDCVKLKCRSCGFEWEEVEEKLEPIEFQKLAIGQLFSLSNKPKAIKNIKIYDSLTVDELARLRRLPTSRVSYFNAICLGDGRPRTINSEQLVFLKKNLDVETKSV